MRRRAQRIQVVGGCSLPAPAVKNDHKRGGLKEYTLVFSQSGGQKSNNQCFWAKVKVLAEPVSSGGCKESPLSCLLELPESACTSWLLAIPHIPTTSSIPTSLHSSYLQMPPSFPLMRMLVTTLDLSTSSSIIALFQDPNCNLTFKVRFAV